MKKWKALPPGTYLEISGQFTESQQKSLSPEIRTWIPFCPILTHQTYLELITECPLRKLSSQCPAWMSDLCRCSCGVFVHHPLASLLLLSASLHLSPPPLPQLPGVLGWSPLAILFPLLLLLLWDQCSWLQAVFISSSVRLSSCSTSYFSLLALPTTWADCQLQVF